MPTLIQSQTVSTNTACKYSQLLATILLGLIVLSAVGFAPLDIIHNATHDTRHSSGFPCH